MRLLTTALILLGTGCVLPIPTARHTPKSATTRGEIEAQRFQPLEPGTATRADVLLRLGEPDVVTSDERLLIYRWVSISGYVATMSESSSSSDPIGTRRCDVAVELDAAGKVVRIGEIEKLAREPASALDPPELPLPLEASLLLRQTGAKLVMRHDSVAIVPNVGQEGRIEIPAGRVVELLHESDSAVFWGAGWLSYRLTYRGPDGKVESKRFELRVTSLPMITRYLRQHSPDAKFRDAQGGGCMKTIPPRG